jgi:hypothetical protein
VDGDQVFGLAVPAKQDITLTPLTPTTVLPISIRQNMEEYSLGEERVSREENIQ